MKFKTAQGQEFRRRKRDSDKWKRHKIALEKERTHVSACKAWFFKIYVGSFLFLIVKPMLKDPITGELGRVKVLHRVFLRPKFWRVIFKRYKYDDSDKECLRYI